MVLKSELFTGEDVDAGVFEDDGPFLRVVDAIARVGGIVLIPNTGGGLGEVDDGILGDVEGTVGSVGTGDGDCGVCGSEWQQREGGGEKETLHGEDGSSALSRPRGNMTKPGTEFCIWLTGLKFRDLPADA
jgi:hypothetical protein